MSQSTSAQIFRPSPQNSKLTIVWHKDNGKTFSMGWKWNSRCERATLQIKFMLRIGDQIHYTLKKKKKKGNKHQCPLIHILFTTDWWNDRSGSFPSPHTQREAGGKRSLPLCPLRAVPPQGTVTPGLFADSSSDGHTRSANTGERRNKLLQALPAGERTRSCLVRAGKEVAGAVTRSRPALRSCRASPCPAEALPGDGRGRGGARATAVEKGREERAMFSARGGSFVSSPLIFGGACIWYFKIIIFLCYSVGKDVWIKTMKSCYFAWGLSHISDEKVLSELCNLLINQAPISRKQILGCRSGYRVLRSLF